MDRSFCVYVAGPITKDPLGGTRQAIRAAAVLMDAGLTPYVPHLDVLWELVEPRPYEDWMRLGLAWLERCDALLRLPGTSAGADVEVAKAAELGIPVFPDVPKLLDWVAAKRAQAAELRDLGGALCRGGSSREQGRR